MRIRVKGHNISDYSNNTKEELEQYFIHMCTMANFEKVKYLLDSPEFNGITRPHPHTDNDKAFNWLMRKESTQIIDYLIFEYNIERTKDIDEILNKHNNTYSEIVKNKFVLREVNKLLNSDLAVNEKAINKIKI